MPQHSRDNISLGMKRMPVPKEKRKKLAEAAKGHVVTEETREKISETLKLRNSMGDELYHRYYYEKHWREDHDRMANAQMEIDLRTCIEMKDPHLYKDVKRSRGYRQKRRVWDPTGRVSDGFYYGRIWWPLVAEKKDGEPGDR